MVVGRRPGIMRLAMIVVTMAPENQLFEHEENQDTEQHGSRHFVRLAMLQRMRQDFQEGSTEQRADRVGNQDIDPMHAHRKAQYGSSDHAQCAAGQRHGDDPRKCAHKLLLLG